MMIKPEKMNNAQPKITVYVRAEGSGKWSLIAILAEIKALLFLLVRSSKHAKGTLWYEKCFDVENQRYAYLFALKEQQLVSCVEHWHFLSFGPWPLSMVICYLLDFLGRRLDGVAHRYFAFDAKKAGLLRQRVAKRLDQTAIIWMEGSCDRCLPWSQVSEMIAASVFTICYPINWHPWRFSDVSDGRYGIYLYDETWQLNELKTRCRWAREKPLFELIKIPNYIRTFVETDNAKEWDICIPGNIQDGKKQIEILEAASVAAQEMGVQLNVIVIGRILETSVFQDIKMLSRKYQNVIKVSLKSHVSRVKLARIMARSCLVVSAAKWDAAPRIVQEALCCNTPVLMNSEILCGSKYLVSGTGLQKPLNKFAEGMIEILSGYKEFRPRESFLAFAHPEETLLNFIEVVNDATKRWHAKSSTADSNFG